MLLNSLIIVLVIEVGASLALTMVEQEPEAASIAEQVERFKQKQLSLAYYHEQDWARAYWDEHMQIVDHWNYQPYIVWRTWPFTGDYININQDGIRQTPESNCSDESYRIFVFGGSTMWGFGSPDWGTIPAYLQAGLAGLDTNVCVINQADVAFNSTQSIIKLLLELQQGNVPDMVIFYDGANDVTIANLTNEAGTHFYLDAIEQAVQGNLAFGPPTAEAAPASPLVEWLRQSATFRLVQNIVANPTTNEVGPALGSYSTEFIDSIMAVYLTNINTATLLADEYEFEFIAFWQPVLVMHDEPATDEEQRFLWEMPGGLPELFRVVYAQAEAAAATNDHLHYLGNVLENQAGDLWIDFNHLTPSGNEIVADKILDVIMPNLDR